MWDNYVGNAIRRGNRNLLIWNGAILAIIALIGALSERYIYNCLNGPFPMTKEQIAAIHDPATLRKYFIKLDGLKTFRTGITYVRTKNGSSTTEAEYLAARLPEKNLLIKSPVPGSTVVDGIPPPTSFEGELVPIESGVRTKLIDQLGPNKPIDSVLQPFMLDAMNFRAGFYVSLIFAIPLALLAIFNVARALYRMSDMAKHPLVPQLEKFGQPAQVTAMQIDREVQQPVARPSKTLTVTPNFLLSQSLWGLRVVRLGDILWAYQKVVQHRTNFVNTGKTFHAVVYDRSGKAMEFGGTKQATVDLLGALGRQAPWAIVGYNDDLKKRIKKDLGAIVAAVDARRAQVRVAQS